MVKNWIVYLLGLLGVLVFHGYYFGWYSWFVLQLMILLPLFSLLLSLPAMLLAKVRLEVVDHCFRHDAVYVYLRTGSGFLPLPQCRFRLRLSNCMTGESTVLRQKTAGKDHWYVKVDTSHVGMLQCRAERVRVYDYLKLFRIPVRNVRPVRIIIAPVEEEPTRLPNLSRFLVKNLRPKPGGGFSEEHEMRRYRPGDALRDIHWKLSVKTDTLIVREAQEPVHPNVMLSLDLAGTAEQVDCVLGRFVWLSKWLLAHETPHRLLWLHPEDFRVITEELKELTDIDRVLDQMLRVRLRPDTPSVAHRRFPGVDWRYHIAPEQEVET